MKNITYIYLLITALFVMASCQKDEIGSFTAKPAINFVADSTQFSFVQEPANEHVLEIPVAIIGDTTSNDRYFEVEVLQDSLTTADENLYEIMEGKIPAGKFAGNLSVKLKKSPALDTRAVALHLSIAPSVDFVAGNTESNKIKVIWSNAIIVPDWTWFKFFFTRYPSTAAYRIFIETTGRTSFTFSDYRGLGPTGAQALGTAFGDYIRKYNSEHPDNHLVHDDGPNEGEEIIPIY